MRIIPPITLLALVGFAISPLCRATVIGIAPVEQPVNLGAKSDPQRIPLGSVGVINNHGYGIQRMIGEARPAPDGAMQWDGGTELNQNLASVFGISVEAEDPTQIEAFPVTLRVKPWKIPGYSPYTKEQVLAATLWCLLRSTRGTPDQPLDVRVVAEGPDDQALVAKYSGKYVVSPGRDQKEVPPVDVAGTELEVDHRGIAWVTFPDVVRSDHSPSPEPTLIVLANQGDGDPGWYLLPVWGNGSDEKDFLSLNNRAATICYSSWQSRGVTNANSFFAGGGANIFSVSRNEDSTSVSLNYPAVEPATLAANILALVISVQPTDANPLRISVTVEESGLLKYAAFRDLAGWQETRSENANSKSSTLQCEFVWDAAAQKLARGTVPLVRLSGLGVILPNPESEKPSAAVDREIAAAVEARIEAGIQDGSLLAEKVMNTDDLPASGLKREIAMAGYYEGLAFFCNGKSVPERPLNNPARFDKPEFDRTHDAAWIIGLDRGQTIANEVRKNAEASEVETGK